MTDAHFDTVTPGRKRSYREEQAFRGNVADYFRRLLPAKIAVTDIRGQQVHVVPTTQTCPEPTCIDGQAYDPERGLIPCPVCGGDICPTCGGSGMYAPERHVDDPDFGQVVFCPQNCRAARELRQAHTTKLYAGARLPDGYQDCTLESFQELVSAGGDKAQLWRGKMLAYYAVEAFIANDGHAVDYAEIVEKARGARADDVFSDVRNSLVLHGPHGVGKTGFAAAIVNALARQGQVVRYIRTQDFIAAVQRRYGKNWQDSSARDDFGDMDSAEVLAAVKHVPVLILDEFDMPDADTPNKLGLIENVIRHRTGYLMPTIITTNLDADGLEERWGTTTLSVLKQRAHFIPVGGTPLRAVPQAVAQVL